LTTEL